MQHHDELHDMLGLNGVSTRWSGNWKAKKSAKFTSIPPSRHTNAVLENGFRSHLKGME